MSADKDFQEHFQSTKKIEIVNISTNRNFFNQFMSLKASCSSTIVMRTSVICVAFAFNSDQTKQTSGI